MITHEDIDVYTTNLCWSLAWHIHLLTGWPLVTYQDKPGDPYSWFHVAVRIPDGELLDITGTHSDAYMRKHWAKTRVFFFEGHFRNRRQYRYYLFGRHWDPWFQRDIQPARTVALAKYLVDTYG